MCKSHRLTLFTTLTGILVVVCACSETKAQNKPGSGTQYNVTSTIFNALAGQQLSLQSDDPSDGQATYDVGDKSVGSAIDGSGSIEWDLRLQNSARSFYLQFVPASPLPGGAPSGSYLFSGRVVSRCFDMNNNPVSWFSIVPGSPDTNCAMRVNFALNGTNYTLVMSPVYAGTGRAEVSCNASDAAGSCNDWTVVSNGAASFPGIANLYAIGRSGKEIFVASYYLTYNARVTYP